MNRVSRLFCTALGVLVAGALSFSAFGQTSALAEVKFIASELTSSFGHSIAVSGNTVLVGAPQDDGLAGSAYVFIRSSAGVVQQAKLTASDGLAFDQFGESVAISGDTAVVGAIWDDSQAGSVYVFVRSGTAWTQQAKLIASDRANNDEFGNSVAISGDTIIVGAARQGFRAGSAYVFVRSGATWTQQARLDGSNSANRDGFGHRVGISGDTAVIGARREDGFAGSAYAFVRSGTTWSQQARLTASDRAIGDEFGISVAISGDTILAGAWSNAGAGAAYTFVRSGTNWNQEAKLTASDGAGGDAFGTSVAITANTAVVGAAQDDRGAGSGYAFTRSAATWTQQAKLTASDRLDSTFGFSVAISGETIVVGSYTADAGGGVAYLYAPPVFRRPVFILPGIGATYATDVTNDLPWLIRRGVDPSMMQIDPLARTYHDLIKTFENAGYQQDKDLFVVNYDWRVTPGPDDGVIDGHVGGLTAASISANVYRYGVDYLGDALKRAAVRWEQDHPNAPPLDAVDVIAHSTGGLVARTYIQSNAYGGIYTGTKTLPKVNNLVMIGVPNRGASKPWNPLQDNWVIDPGFEFVLAKIVNRAYQKVLNGAIIAGPDGNISLATLTPPACVELPEVCFINQYVPTIRSLLATYNFIDFGAGFTNVNSNPNVRNSLVLDLNAGLDLSLVGDPNSFAAGTLVKPTVIFGTNGNDEPPPLPGLRSGTPTAVVERLGPASGIFSFLSIANFAEVGSRNARAGEAWFFDNLFASSGDGTVPLESSRDQFVGDTRLVLLPFTKGGNTPGLVGHTDLPSNLDVQQAVLDILGAACAPPCQISTGLGGAVPQAAACAATGCLNFTLDPVEGFVVDRLGRRLGYTAATGAVTEIPNSVWYGNVDGTGWVFGAVEEPLTMELTGLGGHYYANVSVLGMNGKSGAVAEGVLAAGAQRSVPVPPMSHTPKFYTVTPSAGTDGIMTPSVPQSVAFGEVATFTIVPSPGLVANVTGTCGGSLVNNVFTTRRIGSDCTVNATFGSNITLLSVKSRKTHGTAGTHNLDIDTTRLINGDITVEPRRIGAGHTLVFTFSGPVNVPGSVIVTPVGSATSAFSDNDVMVTLTNVPDNRRVSISLENVNNLVSTTPVAIGFLVGDVSGSHSVNASDISGVKAQAGLPITGLNFKLDVNANGAIDAADISQVKARSGLRLPFQ